MISLTSSRFWDHSATIGIRRHGMICHHKYTARQTVSHEPHQHVGIELLYCKSGRGTFTFGEVVYPFSKGDLFLFDAQIPHLATMNDTYERWNLCFTQEMMKQVMQEGNFQAIISKFDPGERGINTFRIHPTEQEQLIGVFRDLRIAFRQRQRHFIPYVQIKLIELFILLDQMHGDQYVLDHSDVAEVPNTSKLTLNRVVTYVEEHLSQDLTVQSIADAFHYSPSYLYRLFMIGTGKTPSQYIRSRRIERAKQLLILSDLPIKEIAHSVGTTNVSYFSKMFRNEMGCTAGEYRSRYR